MEELPKEILYIIVDSCDFLSKIRLSSINIYFHKMVMIDDLMNIPEQIIYNINDDVLQQSKYNFLKKLNANNQVTQTGISRFNLTELDAYNNKNINDLSFMKNLKKLNASGFSWSIHQNVINGLDLVKLIVCDNEHIRNVSFMKNLKYLNAGGRHCVLGQKGIRGLDLHYLYAGDNYGIYDVTFMKNLTVLDVGCYTSICGIDQEGINGLNLKKLHAFGNRSIHNVC